MVIWTVLHQTDVITFGAFFGWIVATALLFLASYVLVTGTGVALGSPSPVMGKLCAPFFICLGAHFLVAVLIVQISTPIEVIGLTTIFTTCFALVTAAGAFLTTDKRQLLFLVAWMGVVVSLIIWIMPTGVNPDSVVPALRVE